MGLRAMSRARAQQSSIIRRKNGARRKICAKFPPARGKRRRALDRRGSIKGRKNTKTYAFCSTRAIRRRAVPFGPVRKNAAASRSQPSTPTRKRCDLWAARVFGKSAHGLSESPGGPTSEEGFSVPLLGLGIFPPPTGHKCEYTRFS